MYTQTQEPWLDHADHPGQLTKMILEERDKNPNPTVDIAALSKLFRDLGFAGIAKAVTNYEIWRHNALSGFGSVKLQIGDEKNGIPAIHWLFYFGRRIELVPLYICRLIDGLCENMCALMLPPPLPKFDLV